MKPKSNTELSKLIAERDYYKSLVETFFSATIPPQGGSIDHFIMLKWGKRRLEDMRQTPALLRNEGS